MQSRLKVGGAPGRRGPSAPSATDRRRLLRVVSALAAAIAGTLALAACGGGKATTTTSAPPPPAQRPPVAKAPKPSPAKAPDTSPAKVPKREPVTAVAAEKKAAGGAAPFVVKGADNSIPTYGAEGLTSQGEAATASLRAYFDARAEGDWRKACGQLSALARRQLKLLAQAEANGKNAGCAAAYALLASHSPGEDRRSPLTGGLVAFRVKGEKAFALFYGPHRHQYMMPMDSEGGSWKPGMIDPVPYPPGSPPQGG